MALVAGLMEALVAPGARVRGAIAETTRIRRVAIIPRALPGLAGGVTVV